jgi:hypothetical protein
MSDEAAETVTVFFEDALEIRAVPVAGHDAGGRPLLDLPGYEVMEVYGFSYRFAAFRPGPADGGDPASH